jgi:hypothetical protein
MTPHELRKLLEIGLEEGCESEDCGLAFNSSEDVCNAPVESDARSRKLRRVTETRLLAIFL